MNQPKWLILFYIEDDGTQPVKEYITACKNKKDIAVILQVIQSLSLIGLDLLDTKMCKKIDNNIKELVKGHHRILFAQDGNSFILLSAFYKKTKKTPINEKIKANDRFLIFLANKNQRSFQNKIYLNWGQIDEWIY